MKQARKWTAAAVAVAALLVLGLYLKGGTFGVSRGRLEQDARGDGRIDADWQSVQAITDSIAGLLFYSEDLSDATYSIYIKRDGLSFGYFFRLGGSGVEVDRGIAGFSFAGSDRVFLSMNRAGVCRMEVEGWDGLETVEIDGMKPFAMAVPAEAGLVTFYDEAGNSVEWSRIDRV